MKELDFDGVKVWEIGSDVDSNKTYIIRFNSDFLEKSYSLYKRLNSKEIFLSDEYKLDNIKIFEDFEFQNLKSLSIAIPILDISPIHNICNQLEELTFEYFKNGKLDLSKFNNLKFLGGDWNNKVVNLNSCINLEKIKIFKFNQTNLKQLGSLDKLKHLELINSKLENLEGIENLSSLEVLDLHSSKKLVSLNGLTSKNKKLRNIRVYGAPNLIDSDSVKVLKNLTRFNLARVKKIKSLAFLNECNKIEDCIIHPANVKVQDGNYSPLDRFKK